MVCETQGKITNQWRTCFLKCLQGILLSCIIVQGNSNGLDMFGYLVPIKSIYGSICTYIYNKYQLNVGKYISYIICNCSFARSARHGSEEIAAGSIGAHHDRCHHTYRVWCVSVGFWCKKTTGIQRDYHNLVSTFTCSRCYKVEDLPNFHHTVFGNNR